MRFFRAILVCCLLSPWSLPALGAGETVQAATIRGFDESKVYEGTSIDAISTFNGGVALSIPIGPTYQAGANLSYQLTLTHGGHLWDYYVGLGRENSTETCCKNVAKGVIQRNANAGAGWLLTLGQLFPPNRRLPGELRRGDRVNQSNYWMFVDSAGGTHRFSEDLHGSIADDGVASYTRDNSYLRLKPVQGNAFQRTVEMPDGTRYLFECAAADEPDDSECWRLRRIEDPWVTPEAGSGSWVRIDYFANRWDISDSEGRVHKVFLTPVTGHESIREVIDRIELTRFNGGARSNSTVAVYDLQYEQIVVARQPHPNLPEAHRFKDEATPVAALGPTPFLQAVAMPAGAGRYTFDYVREGQPFSTVLGAVRGYGVPTGAYTLFDHDYLYGVEATECDPNAPPDSGDATPAFQRNITLTKGIRQKRLYAQKPADLSRPGEDHVSRWRYRYYVSSESHAGNPDKPGHLCGTTSRQLASMVLDPAGDASLYYYSLYSEEEQWSGHGTSPGRGWTDLEYGLSLTRYQTAKGIDGQELYRSSEIYDCPDGFDPDPPTIPAEDAQRTPGIVASCSILRRSFVAYEYDLHPPCIFEHDLDCTQLNRRLVGSKTVFFDDTAAGEQYKAARHSGFDGLGHHRETRSESNFTSDDAQVVRTEFNPGRSVNDIPRPGEPWILGTYAARSITRGSQTARTEFCFDASRGHLKATRGHRYFNQGQSKQDVLTTYEVDGRGQVNRINWYGGDLTVVPTNQLPGEPGCSVDVTGITPEYSQAVNYQHGTASRVAWLAPATKDVEFLLIGDSSIDPNTGLPFTTRDAAGVETLAVYDALGRITSLSTPGFGTTTYTYCVKSDAACGENLVTVTTSAGDTPIGSGVLRYDALGRLVEKSKDIAAAHGSVRAMKQLYQYDALSRVVRQSVPGDAPSLGARGEFMEYVYDVLGRTTKVTQPDATHSETEYLGDRKIITKVRMHTAGGDVVATRSLEHDGMGRVAWVTEDSAADGSAVTTRYRYDVNGNLIETQTPGVDTGLPVQKRLFEYDALGRLRGEVIPERPEVPVQHSLISTLGHVGRVAWTGTGRALSSTFDKAGRLIAVREAHGAGTRPLLENFYAAWPGDGSSGNKKAGKPIAAKRHNYVADASGAVRDYVVTRTYSYGHPAGLMSAEQLRVAALTPGSAVHQTSDMAFETLYSYDASGSLRDLTYPSVDLMGLAASLSPDRVVRNLYTRKTLTKVAHLDAGQPISDLVSLDYHNNGTLSVLTHHLRSPATPVTETFARDPHGMARTHRIDVSAGSWTTGTYQYDAAGNVTRIGADEFFYDEVGRLTRGSVNGVVQSAAFDAMGNVTSLLTDGAATPLAADGATNRLTGPGVSYDAFGNVTQWHSRALAYDSYDMVSRIADAGAGALRRSFVYSPGNARVGVIDHAAGKETWSIRGPAGKTLREFQRAAASGILEWRKDYLYSGTRLVASLEKSAADTSEKHYHIDHLGSTRLVTDGAGSEVARYDYLPFGGLASKTGSQAHKENMLFTGHERDANGPGDSDDLDYMMARFYSPANARFLSIDPLAGSVASPQTWNRYTYVRNNPVGRADPTGMAEAAPAQGGLRQTDFGLATYHDTCASGVGQCLARLNNAAGNFKGLIADAVKAGDLKLASQLGADFMFGHVLPAQAGLLARGGGPGAAAGAALDKVAGDVMDATYELRVGGGFRYRTFGAMAQVAVALVGLATPASGAARGTSTPLGKHGGYFSSSRNAAGGEVWTSRGRIGSDDFAGIVENAVSRGEPVNIISGTHGGRSGWMSMHQQFYADDVARFGSMPGVKVYDIHTMGPGEIGAVLRGEGTVIGATCNSGVCLAPMLQ